MKSPGKRVINEKRGKNINLVSPKNILKNVRAKPGKIQQTRGSFSYSVQTVIFFPCNLFFGICGRSDKFLLKVTKILVTDFINPPQDAQISIQTVNSGQLQGNAEPIRTGCWLTVKKAAGFVVSLT